MQLRSHIVSVLSTGVSAQLAIVVVTAVVAFGLSTLIIPPLIRVAVRRSWLDVPKEARRVHTVPVPRLGGVAVFAATGLTFAVALLTVRQDIAFFRDPIPLPALIGALSVVFIAGLVDDLTGLRPRIKFAAQLIAAGILVRAGFRIESIALAVGMPALSLGWLSIPITTFWLVGITNAFNLIDGIDGLAGTVAVLALVVTIIADVLTYGSCPPLLSVALIGAVAGFLRHNLSPASIFLGDAGAMTLGLFIATRVTMASTSAEGATYVVLPLFVLVLPLLDTGLAMGRRWLRGDSVSVADGRHIHHQLLSLGLTTNQTVRLLGGAMLVFSLVGFVVVFAPPQLALALLASTGILLAIGLLYLIRWLGYAEFGELGSSLVGGVRDVRSIIRDRILANEVAAKIREATTIDEVTVALRKLTDDMLLLDVQILEGDMHLQWPQRQQVLSVDKLPVRLDYPCAWELNGKVEQVILRLWSSRPTPTGAHGIERIACRVGPALEEWLSAHADPAATAMKPSVGRDPGS